jgi:hypothetical protein
VELAALLNRLRTLRTLPAHGLADGTGPEP